MQNRRDKGRRKRIRRTSIERKIGKPSTKFVYFAFVAHFLFLLFSFNRNGNDDIFFKWCDRLSLCLSWLECMCELCSSNYAFGYGIEVLLLFCLLGSGLWAGFSSISLFFSQWGLNIYESRKWDVVFRYAYVRCYNKFVSKSFLLLEFGKTFLKIETRISK